MNSNSRHLNAKSHQFIINKITKFYFRHTQIWFWRYLMRGLIWHLCQSSIRPSIYFSLIVKSHFTHHWEKKFMRLKFYRTLRSKTMRIA